jgi:hypothetical protein
MRQIPERFTSHSRIVDTQNGTYFKAYVWCLESGGSSYVLGDLCNSLFRSEVSYGEVVGGKSAMYIRVTLYWGYLIVLRLFHLSVSCTVLVLTCFVVCGCFGVCTWIYCVLYSLYCVFVLFRLCILTLICFACTSVRTTATEWQLNCNF